MTSLRDEIRGQIEAAMESAIPEPWEVSAHFADAILQLITTRLTSEEAVEAFHATFERFGQLGALKCQRISDDHARAVIQAAIGRVTDA